MVRFSLGERCFSLVQIVPTCSGFSGLQVCGYGSRFMQSVTWLVYVAELSFLSNIYIKNEGSFTSTLRYVGLLMSCKGKALFYMKL